jgi:tyrosyl-tRNA synthetase
MPHFPPIDEQLALIRRGAEEILPETELAAKLERAEKTGTPLRVKLGCDPSRPDLHIGHAVVLRKLRQFQDLGHQAVLIVGDFTAMIGDPTGKSKTRPALTLEESRANGQSYWDQAGQILDLERAEIVHNSDWLGEMTFADVIGLAGKYTVARMLERDDFSKRYAEGEPISLHEFLYPLAQAQDSVHVRADVELGGTDQKFNLLVGREIQSKAGLEPQVCLTMPILEGTDGVEKMSKSLDNYIGLTDAPADMYGKTLSIPDVLIERYLALAADAPDEQMDDLRAFIARDPRNAKHDLALRLTALYHGAEAAREARAHFERTVVQGEAPHDMDELVMSEPTGLLTLIREAGFAQSNGEARRLVQQGAVSLGGDKLDDPAADIAVPADPVVLQVGKRRFVRLVPRG